jgi:hypothetical protein
LPAVFQGLCVGMRFAPSPTGDVHRKGGEEERRRGKRAVEERREVGRGAHERLIFVFVRLLKARRTSGNQLPPGGGGVIKTLLPRLTHPYLVTPPPLLHPPLPKLIRT